MILIEKIKAIPTPKKVFYGLVGATIIIGSIWTVRKIMEQRPAKPKKKK
jgi:hypothetical protein